MNTISSGVKINHVSYTDVDNTEETLVLLFKFLLIKDLNGKDTVFRCFPTQQSVQGGWMSKGIVHVKDLIPIGI